MKDDAAVVQLWTVSPNGGAPRQVTHNAASVASAFSWSPDGRRIAHVLEGRVVVTDVETGTHRALTAPCDAERQPRPEACVFSPDGARVAYVRTVGGYNQVFVASVNSR
jgi:Tol biopolymer transport system component